MGKSFYDLDYIIEINERRIEQYLSAYQKVLDRFTNIILIYSSITIFLTSVIRLVFFNKDCSWVLFVCFGAFVVLFSISLYYAIRLIIPVEVWYLSAPQMFYEEVRLTYEKSIQIQNEIDKKLKASYINELERTLKNNKEVFNRKSSFYYSALIYALLSAIPYIICIAFYISPKEGPIQKVKIINSENFSTLVKIDSMFSIFKKKQKATNITNDTQNDSSITKDHSTDLPGVDMSKIIIQVYPDMIKENSWKVKNKTKFNR